MDRSPSKFRRPGFELVRHLIDLLQAGVVTSGRREEVIPGSILVQQVVVQDERRLAGLPLAVVPSLPQVHEVGPEGPGQGCQNQAHASENKQLQN